MNGNLLMGGGAGYDKEAKEAGSNLLTNVVRSFKAAAGDDESQHILNLTKAAAKKQLEKANTVPPTEGGSDSGQTKRVVSGISSGIASSGGGMTPDAGSDPGGDAMQGAIQGAVASGGNPYAAIAGAAMGLIASGQKRAAAKAQAKSQAILVKAGAEESKMKARQNMASAISSALLGGPSVRL